MDAPQPPGKVLPGHALDQAHKWSADRWPTLAPPHRLAALAGAAALLVAANDGAWPHRERTLAPAAEPPQQQDPEPSGSVVDPGAPQDSALMPQSDVLKGGVGSAHQKGAQLTAAAGAVASPQPVACSESPLRPRNRAIRTPTGRPTLRPGEGEPSSPRRVVGDHSPEERRRIRRPARVRPDGPSRATPFDLLRARCEQHALSDGLDVAGLTSHAARRSPARCPAFVAPRPGS